MLTSARDLVREQGVISAQEVALKLGVPADVARAALQKWVEKGRIERLPTPAACIGCMLCDSAPREFYRWCGKAAGGITDDLSSTSSADQSEGGCNTRVPSACPAGGPFQDQA